MRPARHPSRRDSGDPELHTPLRSVPCNFARRISLSKADELLAADGVAFKEVLVMGQELDADETHDKWLAFGGSFLDVTSKYAMRLR